MRKLVRWEPMRGFPVLSHRMDRLVDELMGHGCQGLVDDRSRDSWVPAVDILEKQDVVELVAELPGLKADQVEVTVNDGVLTIRGERAFDEAAEGETFHRVERRHGAFERTFKLPSSADPERIEARFKHGVMTVVLPKREESKPRSVKVEIDAN